jgi:glutaredoxin
MYVLIGKETCNQCNILKNLLDEKGIQYHYVDVSKIPRRLLTYLRIELQYLSNSVRCKIF